MFTRMLRKNIPFTFRILNLTPNSNYLYKVPIATNIEARTFSVVGNKKNYELRQYSQKNNTANITVEYNYVKKAVNNNNVYIIDVREPEELKEHGFIPSSVNIPLGSVTTALGTMSDKEFKKTFNRPKPSEDTEIIFYCMIGKRSGMAQQNAFNLGYKNTKNYLGSWTDWVSKTQETDKKI